MKPIIQTFTGKAFNLFSPTTEMVDIADIAHSLSMICRYNGHCKQFYSVAEHSVLMARLSVSPRQRLCCLLHDASEAYVGDMTRPLKLNMPEFKRAESRIADVIMQHFGLDRSMLDEVKQYDMQMLADEHKLLMENDVGFEGLPGPSGLFEPMYWAPKEAEEKFLRGFHDVMGVIYE